MRLTLLIRMLVAWLCAPEQPLRPDAEAGAREAGFRSAFLHP